METMCVFDCEHSCGLAPCTEAQGVKCCGACPFKNNCNSACTKNKEVGTA